MNNSIFKSNKWLKSVIRNVFKKKTSNVNLIVSPDICMREFQWNNHSECACGGVCLWSSFHNMITFRNINKNISVILI